MSWQSAIHPRDWAAMTRLHESSHVAASEALGIEVNDVWANVDPRVAHGGQYNNGLGDSQLQAVVQLIGAEGGAKELRERGYGDDIAHTSTILTGASDRERARAIQATAAQHGYRIDTDLAYYNALQILDAPGFSDASHNVAEALADRGDRLTGADVRAAIGSFQLDRDGLWIPTASELSPPGLAPVNLDPQLPAPADPAEHDLDDEADIDL
ncbi:hypothetical protein [Streptomyces sp. BH105]|uniref:hypothetical protein n=1 Tax=Streptomyces sp. BH105 TaxID=3410408 RepID=UPI003CF50D44